MNAKRQLGLLTSAILVVASVWACQAVRNPDRSWSISFAPDMTITAWGLEDALGKLSDLMDKCVSGTFGRPCTATEMAEINKAIDRIASSKDRLKNNFVGGRVV